MVVSDFRCMNATNRPARRGGPRGPVRPAGGPYSGGRRPGRAGAVGSGARGCPHERSAWRSWSAGPSRRRRCWSATCCRTCWSGRRRTSATWPAPTPTPGRPAGRSWRPTAAADEPTALRAVGQVTTETEPPGRRPRPGRERRAGSTPERLLEGTPLESAGGERIGVHSMIDVDADRQPLRAAVGGPGRGGRRRAAGDRGPAATGTRSPCGRGARCCRSARWSRRFPYRARGMVQNAIAPMDRLPGPPRRPALGEPGRQPADRPGRARSTSRSSTAT